MTPAQEKVVSSFINALTALKNDGISKQSANGLINIILVVIYATQNNKSTSNELVVDVLLQEGIDAVYGKDNN